MQKSKSRTEGSTLLISCAVGILAALIISLLISGVAAIFISSEYLNIENMLIIGIFVQLLSVMIGSFVAGKIVGNGKRLIACCAVASVYYLGLLGCALLFSDGVSGGVFSGLVACGVGCFLANMLCIKRKISTKRTRKRRSYR